MMGLTDSGLRGRAIDKLKRAEKLISNLKYDEARDVLFEADDILKVLQQGK